MIFLRCLIAVIILSGCGAGTGGGNATSGQNNNNTDALQPSIPLNLIVTAASSNQINLSWSAATDNVEVTGYKVYKNGTYLTSVTSTSSSDTGLRAGTSYCYTVSAIDAAGNESGQSSQKCDNTQAIGTVPNAPDNLIAAASSNTQVNLSWTDKSNNEDGFKIERKAGNNGIYSNITTTTSNTTSYSDTGLSANTTYCYKLKAYNSTGTSGYSNENCITTLNNTTTDKTPPSKPTNFAVMAVSSDQINLSWTASTDNTGITGYSIYRSNTYLKSLSTTSADDKGLSPSTQYCYTVSASDAAGNESAKTSQLCATTQSLPVDTQLPSTPTNLTVNAVSSTQIDIAWTASTDNVGVTGYKIYRNDTYLTSVTTTSKSDAGLNPSTQYCYTVSAIDAAGNESAKTSQVCATTTTQLSLEGTINHVVDYSGDIELLGEVKNVGNKPVSFVKIECTFKDSSGGIIDKDYTYIDGSCMTLPLTDIETDTILKPNEIGAFKMYTYILNSRVTSFSCDLNYEEYDVKEPDAKLIIDGNITSSKDYLNFIKFSGNVKNTGTSDLIFGKIHFAIKDSDGKVIDTAFTYIDGSKVYLSSISDFTDTALYVNGVGTFSLFTMADYYSSQHYYYKTCWNDSTITSGTVYKLKKPENSLNNNTTLTEKQILRERNNEIDILRENLKSLH